MKKIALTITLSLTCMGLFAQIGPNPSIPNDPVDYSRLVLPTDEPAYPAVFVMSINGAEQNDAFELISNTASMNFKEVLNVKKIYCMGQLIHTWDIPQDFVETCIQKALEDSKIGTRDKLARMIINTPIFKDFDYTTDDWINDMLTMASAVAPTKGVGTIVMTGAGLIAGTASGNMDGLGLASAGVGYHTGFIEAAGGKAKIMGRVGKALSYAQVVKMMADAYDREQMTWDNRVNLLNMRRIDYFYYLANKYLRTGADKYEKVWMVSVPESSGTVPVTFRGEVCSVTWSVKACALKLQNLPKKVGVPGANFDGEYFGYFDAVANFDLSNYDRNYIVSNKGAADHVTTQDYKGLTTIDDPVRNNLNTYIAMSKDNPALAVFGINNSGTKLVIHYKSPIRLYMEMPPLSDEQYLMTDPDYFWDFYDNDTESVLNKTSVMKAMGLTGTGRESDVEFRMTLDKRYTFKDNLNHTTEKIVERVEGNNYIMEENGNMTAKMPVRDVDFSTEIQTDIPSGTLVISWASEIQPETRDPKYLAEQDWAPLLKKYGIQNGL